MQIATNRLRVLDFGTVSALRSQTTWHAIAYGVGAGEPPTLSFCRPASPYVSLGYHRALAELDQQRCRSSALPVYRRMVGGGCVYLDAGQLFFQITLPASCLPGLRLPALRRLLAPALAAFGAVGVPARLDDALDISVGERKISGYGAGQVGEAVVVCANLIESFDHARATAVLNLPHPWLATEVGRLMRRYVAATPVPAKEFQQAAVAAYADALDLVPEAGELNSYELAKLAELDLTFVDPEWIAGPARPSKDSITVKVRAGIWAFLRTQGPATVAASVRHGVLERVWLSDPELPARTGSIRSALRGLTLSRAGEVLERYGAGGRRAAAAIAGMEGARL